ncbi:GSCOCG00002107001-RA-CDS [Cotesia congregata]|nr:GSCOCG00002107001-RA-CDS [Cotesia congregata]
MDGIELETMNLTWDENFIFLMENWTRLKNMSEEEYLEYQLGPKHLSLSVVVPITVVYVIIFIMGIVGNILTCWVILRHQLMQSATNYYLFSLAISDLLLLILGLPFELSVFWQQYPWELGWGLCKIRAYVSETSSYVSVLTIVAFSMERYLAICHPLHLYAMSGLKRPLRFILAAWILAMIAAIPFAIYTKLNYVEYPPGKFPHYCKNFILYLPGYYYKTLNLIFIILLTNQLIQLSTFNKGYPDVIMIKNANELVIKILNYLLTQLLFNDVSAYVDQEPSKKVTITEEIIENTRKTFNNLRSSDARLTFSSQPFKSKCIMLIVKNGSLSKRETRIPLENKTILDLTSFISREIYAHPDVTLIETFHLNTLINFSYILYIYIFHKYHIYKIYKKCNVGSGRDSEESAFCAMLLPNMPTFPLYELSCLVFFLIPLLLIMVLYIRMGLRIQSTTLGRSIEGTVHGETKQVQSRKSIIRMLMIKNAIEPVENMKKVESKTKVISCRPTITITYRAVVVTFFICWAPFHAQRLLYVYDSKRLLGAINEWLYFLGGCLYYISTAINPILYNVMSAKYRGAFVETLCCTPSINSPLNREDQSSVKETMVYRCGSIRNSQIARGRNRSMRYHLDNSRDDQNNYLQHERFLTNLTVMNNLNDSPGERKLATVIHASNGRAKCKASEKNILLDETHI